MPKNKMIHRDNLVADGMIIVVYLSIYLSIYRTADRYIYFIDFVTKIEDTLLLLPLRLHVYTNVITNKHENNQKHTVYCLILSKFQYINNTIYGGTRWCGMARHTTLGHYTRYCTVLLLIRFTHSLTVSPCVKFALNNSWAKMCVSNDAKIESISSVWQSSGQAVGLHIYLFYIYTKNIVWTRLNWTELKYYLIRCVCGCTLDVRMCIVLACDIHIDHIYIAFNAPWNVSVATQNIHSILYT